MSKNKFDISGRVAVVTGGGGVLGSSIAKSLLEAGVKVVILDIRKEALDNRIAELKETGDEIIGLECNVLDKESLVSVREMILQKWGSIDILLNIAGGNMPGATLTEDQTIFDMKFEDFRKVNDLNLNGTVFPSMIFGEAMAKQGRGSIVNITSMAVYAAITRVPGYSTAKAGVEIFTKWMAMEMAMKCGEKIRVNAIAPGFFIGDQNRAILINPDGSLTERSKKVLAKTPMGRFGDITELNGAVQFLCSDEASFITGAVLPIDGGFSSFSGV
ncbi:SDR family oxidoreductase [Xiashengella succiniciproducens]|jgi:NAD(P)-dependent dehydrogenase (short-subunit alcohol dehydrogenase family)|uniref:SDR family oxidoreductase n=1 Tax=Xiashengella succiniciproducens TaxID=2949635 RepID=A0A9J6ZQS7_9BACT|nr:SDR family oxidoreductase [Alkaliflexus sp. Ai-910]MDI9538782.1 SDR family oxidoreductase [Bacteroidota bacterium]URW79967.1 SDR family oxidoreductase [Alkaliflexus sp. Ai-910]HHU00155.1 SDR family oxidoreductase [Bacteroidales bacterium]